jgi:hypothetical protein
MPLERDGYPPGVPCWVDTAQPDPSRSPSTTPTPPPTVPVELGGQVVMPPFDAPPVRSAVLADPQGAAFAVNTYTPASASA